MGKHTKYMEELQAWKDFELEVLYEPEPEPPHIYIDTWDWDDPDIWDPESGTDAGRNEDYVGWYDYTYWDNRDDD